MSYNPENKNLTQPDKKASLKQNEEIPEEIPCYKDSDVYKNVPQITQSLDRPHLGHTPPSEDEIASSANSERSNEHFRNLCKALKRLEENRT